MRKVKNRVILILIIIVVAIFIIGMIYFITRGESVNDEKIVEMQDDGSKLNIGSKLHEKKEIDGFTIENVSFIEKEGVTELRADVTNKKGEKMQEKKINNTRGITLIALVVTILFSYDEKLKYSNSKGFPLQTI